MADDHRYRPQLLRSGVIVQSGIDLRPRATQRTSIMNPALRPFRAIVINTRVTDEPGNLRRRSVECDVVLVRTQLSIQNVPVLQGNHGVNNLHSNWVPRPSTRIVGADGEPVNVNRVLSRRGTFVGRASSLANLDGDMVLVDFIEGNADFLIIVGALSHERTNRLMTSGQGWREGSVVERGNPKKDEYYLHHYGAEVRINEQGDLLVDTVGAYSDPATEDASATTMGQVRVRVKEGQRFTIAMGDDEDVLEVHKEGSQLRVDLGEGATERIVLGDAFMTLFNTHTHPSGTGPTGVPTQQMQAPQHLSELAKTKQS